jgi:hypothetical protein
MIELMKTVGFIVILSILISLSGPFSLTTPVKQNIKSIVTLDVCHSDTVSLFANSHVTGICVDNCTITYFSSSEILENSPVAFTMPLLSFKLDRPPKT